MLATLGYRNNMVKVPILMENSYATNMTKTFISIVHYVAVNLFSFHAMPCRTTKIAIRQVLSRVSSVSLALISLVVFMVVLTPSSHTSCAFFAVSLLIFTRSLSGLFKISVVPPIGVFAHPFGISLVPRLVLCITMLFIR